MAAIVVLLAGCGPNRAAYMQPASLTTRSAPADVRPLSEQPNRRGHETAHGGALNAIVKCEIGHAEVKREGDLLHVWFVGGAPDTTRAVPIPDKAVKLQMTLENTGLSRTLVLKPEPLDLAGETVGNCSRFAARAPWLQEASRFLATGTVTFKGQKEPLRIEYPDGYDPD